MNAQKDRLHKDIELLTKIRPFRHYWNPDSYKKVSNYTRKEFMKSGLEVEKHKWRARNEEFVNVIASYNKEKSKRLIIGADYEDPERTPGTEDSGSALACLLETARMIQDNKPELDYRIDFIAYKLEQPPFFGYYNRASYQHSATLWGLQVNVIGMIYYEMKGYLSKQGILDNSKSGELAEEYPDNNEYIVLTGREDFADFNEKVYSLMAEGSRLDFKLRKLPRDSERVGMTVPQHYWEFDYPALAINDTHFSRNPYYHKRSDIIDSLNFDRMTEVVNSTYRAVINIV